jgi:hypothetical protein
MPLPDAILVILDGSFHLRATSAILQTRVYVSAAAYLAAREPVSEDPLPLSPTEIAAQTPSLIHACLTELAARPQFRGSSVITP